MTQETKKETERWEVLIQGYLYLGKDSRQFIIRDYHNEKGREEGNYTVLGYPSNLGQFGKWMLNHDLDKNTIADIKELIRAVKEAESHITELFGDVKARIAEEDGKQK